MVCKCEQEQGIGAEEEPSPNDRENSIRNTIYSVGTDTNPNFKERIAQTHGPRSDVMKAVDELDRYISDTETRKNSWFWNFFRRRFS